jgi:hypothetical protein
VSNFEIATLDSREKADFRPLFPGANFKITDFEIREAPIYSIENKSVHTLMWFFAVFRRKTRKTVGQR